MNWYGSDITGTPPGTTSPVVGVYATGPSYTEGATISFDIRRSVNPGPAVSAGYEFTSEGGAADFATTPTGTAYFPAGQLTVRVSVVTAARSGLQGARAVTCRLVGSDVALIDPARPSDYSMLNDYIATPGGWHKALNYRSGRPFAAGPSYFNRRGKDWSFYEDQVSYIDGFGGPNFGGNGSDKGRISTVVRAFGGPRGNPDSIITDGQLYWNTNSDFCKPFREVPVNKTWNCYVCDFTPTINSTDVGNGNPTSGPAHEVWQKFIDGGWDQELKDFGGRLKRNYAARGTSLQWLLMRPFHEMQQTNHYRIYPNTKLLFKNAMERIIDKVREGADYHIRFMHCPSKDRIYNGNDFGSLESWCPSNIDAISISFHPAADANTRSGYLNYINGSGRLYGLENDVAELCARKGYKIAFGEWSPRFSSNQIADQCHEWFYDEFLIPNRNDIVCDFVYHANTLLKDGADSEPDQTAAGKAAWSRSVDVFKGRWKGKGPNWPTYVNPDWPT
jgi:hypothetical protein